jgi:phosphoglycerate dehydrogenase-like enzyme
MQPLAIWTNVSYPAEVMDRLRKGVQGHRLIFSKKQEYSNIAKPLSDENLPQADVVFGQADPEQLMNCPKIKWMHLTSAGYTNYDRDDLRQNFKQRGTQLTNSSSVYAEPCAQHVLAMMLGWARKLNVAVANQLGRHEWLYRQIREQSVLLNGQNVLLVGFGAIGRRVAELLKPFDVNITALRRTPTGDEGVSCRPIGELHSLLPLADHIIDILPLSPTTTKMFGRVEFEKMKPTAIFYNVGRGQTVDSEALRAALTERRIGGAYLDVTDPEPLSPEHPLWTTANCLITPHTAGGHTTEFPRVVQHFLDNLRRYEAGQQLLDRVL